jgi:hypothetical protein
MHPGDKSIRLGEQQRGLLLNHGFGRTPLDMDYIAQGLARWLYGTHPASYQALR